MDRKSKSHKEIILEQLEIHLKRIENAENKYSSNVEIVKTDLNALLNVLANDVLNIKELIENYVED